MKIYTVEKQSYKQINLTTLFAIVLILCLFFQNVLLEEFIVFKYLDEVIACGLFAMYIGGILIGGAIKKRDIILIVGFIVTVMIGLYSNYTAHFQKNIFIIGSDIISCFKFLFVFLGLSNSRSILYKKINYDKVLNITIPILTIYLIILSGFGVLNLVKDTGMYYEIRYGLRAFSFVYGTPGLIINQMTYLLILLGANANRGKKSMLLFFLVILNIMFTLRTRGFALIAIFILLYYYFVLLKRKKVGMQILIILIVIICLGYSQFEFYFLEGATPRKTFILGALKILKEYFPIGTGFATYGSSAAADNYSLLYYILGFNLRYGMSPDTPMFLNDNYWPMILAQFGLAGTITFVYTLYKYLRYVFKLMFKNRSQYCKLFCYFFIFDILFSSIQSSYLAHYSVVTLSLIFMFCFNHPSSRRGENGY